MSAFNLVRVRYGAVAPGLRFVTIGTSVALAALVLVANTIGDEALPAAVIALLLVTLSGFGLRAR